MPTYSGAMATITTNQHHGNKADISVFDFTQGIEVDRLLGRQEIAVQKAWAQALVGAEILSKTEASSIDHCLTEALAQIEEGTFPWSVTDEDIHMNLESFLTERLGELGKRLHLGRSRNDLIATTLRLYVRDELLAIDSALCKFGLAIADRAEKDIHCILPGMTHLQSGQPIRHGHILAAHGWAFARDRERLSSAVQSAMAEMPLGAAALAGTTIAVDLAKLSSALGFTSPNWNSYSAVGDRDFIVEALDALASIALHASRLAEDCILWSSTAFSIISLPKEWSTGSSIMPNKRNPDIAELVRGKSAHIIAAATNAHTLLKGTPSSYVSDLHELKSVLQKSIHETKLILTFFPELILRIEPNEERMRELLGQGHILATEIANHLTSNGVPFRDAYAQTAGLVALANEKNLEVEKLSEADCAQIAPKLDAYFLQKLNAEFAVEQRKLQGGTSLESTRAGIAELRKRMDFKK